MASLHKDHPWLVSISWYREADSRPLVWRKVRWVIGSGKSTPTRRLQELIAFRNRIHKHWVSSAQRGDTKTSEFWCVNVCDANRALRVLSRCKAPVGPLATAELV